MDREEILTTLNNNIGVVNLEVAYKFIVEYLTDKNIELDRINLFLNTIQSDMIFVMNQTFLRCYEHAKDYFTSKYNINSLSKDNKVIHYF